MNTRRITHEIETIKERTQERSKYVYEFAERYIQSLGHGVEIMAIVWRGAFLAAAGCVRRPQGDENMRLGYEEDQIVARVLTAQAIAARESEERGGPLESYRIRRNGQGPLYCECRAATFGPLVHGHRLCKHLVAYTLLRVSGGQPSGWPELDPPAAWSPPNGQACGDGVWHNWQDQGLSPLYHDGQHRRYRCEECGAEKEIPAR